MDGSELKAYVENKVFFSNLGKPVVDTYTGKAYASAADCVSDMPSDKVGNQRCVDSQTSNSGMGGHSSLLLVKLIHFPKDFSQTN